MEIAIKNILDDKLRKDFQLNIPAPLLNQKVSEYLYKIQPEITVDGFVKGQAPVEVIKEKYGKSIMAEQSDILISEAISKIVNDNKYRIATYPKIDFKTFEEGKDVNLVASFEIFPSIPEIDLSKITLNRYITEISEQELYENVEKILKSKLKLVAQDALYLSNFGDILTINFNGNINGEPFEGGFGKEYLLELGSKTFIENFEEQLVGKITGQKVIVSVKFPDDYFRKSIAGKNATFEVEILSISKLEARKFDNEFLKEATGFENFEDFKDNVFNNLLTSYDSTCRAIFKKEFFDYIDSAFKIELPVGLINEQTNFLKNINPDNSNVENLSVEDRLKSLKLSQRMVRCGLILADIASKNAITVSNDEVNNEIQNLTELYPDQADQILQTYNNEPKATQQLQGAILEEKTINFILEKINVVDVAVSPKQIDRLWFDITNNN